MKKGIVIKSTGSWYYVKDTEDKVIPCKIRGSYRMKGIRATNPVAVGDHVSFKLTEDDSGVISDIDSRKNYIIRKSANLSHEYQLIATNIDQAILMISLVKPRTLIGFIDRFLVSAEAFRIPVVLLFNKIDLYGEDELAELDFLISLYEDIGYSCMKMSLKKDIGIDNVRKLMNNKVNVVSGNSGVGKSTLLNTLDSSLDLRTNKISDVHQSGQHTTTYAEMFTIASNTHVIDTPGIKGFGMVDIGKDELFHFFPEIFEVSKNCKFNNCMHVSEPKCAVLKAVEEGQIYESRYISYLSLLDDMDDKYRK